MPPQSGVIPAEVQQAFEAGVFELPERPDPLGTSSATSAWRIPVVLVGFADMPLVHPPSSFDVGLFDSTGATPYGSVYDYWQWASGGRMTVTGEVVAAVQLPHERSYYAYNAWGLNTVATPNNMYGAVRDALLRLPQPVDWSGFDANTDGFVDMLWVVHAGVGGDAQPWDRNNFWSITSSLSSQWRWGDAFVTDDPIPGSTTQFMRIDRFSMLPEMSGIIPGGRAEIGVFCHEFGHALGLPDLYDTSQLGGASNSGPGNWSLMSTGGWGGNGYTPELPTHIGAWPSVFLGWSDPVRPTEDGQMRLGPLSAGGDILELWFQGDPSPEHFLLENRQQTDFDRNLPNSGLVIYQVDEAAIGARLPSNRINWGITPGLRLVEADADTDLVAGRNRGDSNDPFPGALGITELDDFTSPNLRTFLQRITQLRLSNIAHEGADMAFDYQVRAPGWLPALDVTQPGYSPVEAGTAPVLLRAEDGTVHMLRLELFGGKPQVVWRRRVGGTWQSGVQLTQTPGYVLDLDAALLPGGDIALIWTDTRTGTSKLHYRTRLGDSWTQEQVIPTAAGDARNPALAADASGIVHLAWLQHGGGPAQVEYMRFAYSSPWGAAYSVTDTTQPEPPEVVVRPGGGAYVLWTDRNGPIPHIQFSRFHPDSGMYGPLPLTPFALGAQTDVKSGVSPDGTLHSVWLETNTGVHRLRYQRRTGVGFPNPPDQVVASHGSRIENHSLAVDAQGALHLTYQRQAGDMFQACYQRAQPDVGWDMMPTDLTGVADGDATFPVPMATSPGNVLVVFTGHVAGIPRLMTRERILDGAGPVVSVEHPRPLPGPGVRLQPNPLRAGQEIAIAWSGPPPVGGTYLDIYDVAGRRVTAVRLDPEADLRFARIGAGETSRWQTGIYFARIRGSSETAGRFIVLR